jgi:hypothetical protein
MSYNKNVVEDALFQIKNLEETLQENAKGILQSTMTEEIKQLVKESLKEQDEIDEPVNDEDEAMADDDMAMDDDEMAMDDDEMAMDDDEMAMDDDEMAMDDDEMAMDDDEMAMDDDDAIDLTDASDEEVLKVFRAMGDDDGIVVKKEGDFIHLTDEDDDYLIQLGESELGTDNELDEEWSEFDEEFGGDQNNLGETMYEIELDEMDPMNPEMGEMYNMDPELDEMVDPETTDSLEEELYESIKKSMKAKGVGIGRGPKFSYDKKPNMSGGFSEKKKEAFGKGVKAMGTGKAKFEFKEGDYGMNKGDESRTMKGKKDYTTKKGDTLKRKAFEKEETKEASRINNYAVANKVGNRKGSNQNVNRTEIRQRPNRVNEEVEVLKEKNEEYKKALDVFRTKLNEVAVFNSNLAYATRLFTEHSTTKQEKINILKRFDNVESLKESKNLYRTIKNELSSSGSVGEQKLNESIERTVNKTVETGSAVNLIESKTYENPQFLRMKDLMGKLK